MSVDLVPEAEARRILAPHRDRIARILAVGWGSWMQLTEAHPDKVAEQDRRTRASWVSCAMAAEARRLYDQVADVHISDQPRFLTLTFDGKLVLRFKKFSSSKLRTSGIATKQRALFENQQLVLDGMAVSAIVAGYLPDKLEQEIARAAVVCPMNGANVWVLDLDLPGNDELAPVVPVRPTPSTAPGVVVASSTAAEETGS